MRIAFLDFDQTLLAADSNELWMAHLRRRGLVGDDALARHERFMVDYACGVLDFAALQALRQRIDAALGAVELARQRAEFEAAVLLPAIAPGAQALVEALQCEGFATMVVSATREALVRPVASRLGIARVLAADSRPELAVPCFGAGKIVHVAAALQELGTSLPRLAESRFYSDSHNDLPLLEAVSHAVAVDPDPVLARTALRRGWPLMSLRAAQPARSPA